jgi:hypothetical protein
MSAQSPGSIASARNTTFDTRIGTLSFTHDFADGYRVFPLGHSPFLAYEQ